MMWNPFRHWGDKPYECPECGWQGLLEPTPPLNDALCPECGTLMTPRTWMDTWGRTIIVLALVVAAVLFVAYFGRP